VTAIEKESLHKLCGDVTAIADLSLSIADGGFLWLLDSNGADKTTTMERLTG